MWPSTPARGRHAPHQKSGARIAGPGTMHPPGQQRGFRDACEERRAEKALQLRSLGSGDSGLYWAAGRPHPYEFLPPWSISPPGPQEGKMRLGTRDGRSWRTLEPAAAARLKSAQSRETNSAFDFRTQAEDSSFSRNVYHGITFFLPVLETEPWTFLPSYSHIHFLLFILRQGLAKLLSGTGRAGTCGPPASALWCCLTGPVAPCPAGHHVFKGFSS